MADQMIQDRISISTDEHGVADVRLARADKRNALDPAMFNALIESSDLLAKDTSLRAVVLSGEGKGFCAGLDFASFQAMGDSADAGDRSPATTDADEGRITHRGQQAVYGWTELPVPVIAALRGHALGGGIQLALGADIRSRPTPFVPRSASSTKRPSSRSPRASRWSGKKSVA